MTTTNGTWIPCIAVRVDPVQATVHLKFTHAPDQWNISSYIVSLAPYLKSYKILDTTNKTTYTFTNVKPAKYHALVVPLKNGDIKDCKICKRTYSNAFNITKTNVTTFSLQSDHCPKSQPKETVRFNLPLTLIVSLIFAILISISLWFIIKYRHMFHSKQDSVLKNDSQPQPEEKDKIKLCIINTFDHEQHQQACDAFILYLHEHCFCEVLNLNEDYKMMTNLAEIQKAVNFILVIHSEGFSKQLDAWKERKIYPELCKSNPSILLQVMNSTVTNCIECAMNYTNSNYVSQKNSCQQLFSIPDHMTELVCYLHNINLDTTDQENIPLIEEHIYSSADGLAMTQAIDRAIQFEVHFDDWFSRFHPYSFTI